MDKVQLAKALGLEIWRKELSDEDLEREYGEYHFDPDVVFEFNDKYFTVEAHTIESAWQKATDVVLGKLINFITMEGFRDEPY